MPILANGGSITCFLYFSKAVDSNHVDDRTIQAVPQGLI